MRNTQELYNYCKINSHTIGWKANIKSAAMHRLSDQLPRCDGTYYVSAQVEYDYVLDLWMILENKCAEKAHLDDVHTVVNMIFQDIADELEEEFQLYSYSIVLCARLNGWTALWMGPSLYAERFQQAFLESGYEAALASL